jgi:hypothetical protein
MDPFDIDKPVDTIQAFASNFTPCSGMKDKVRMPKDNWFGIDQKTKDLWDQIDGKYKSITPVVLLHFEPFFLPYFRHVQMHFRNNIYGYWTTLERWNIVWCCGDNTKQQQQQQYA